MGRGGGLVVSILALYSNDPSLNPAGYLNFLYEKLKINEEEAGVVAHLKNLFGSRRRQGRFFTIKYCFDFTLEGMFESNDKYSSIDL